MTIAHVLHALPFDFSDPAAHTLWELLWVNLPRQKDVIEIVAGAGVAVGLIHWEQPMQHVWHDVLTVARNQDRLGALLEQVRKHPGSGKALAARLDELIREGPVIEAAPRLPRSDLQWLGGTEALTTGRDTMVDVYFLRLGAQRARAVVRLLVRFAGSTGCGTGFLIAPDLVLTNHHVLYTGPEEDVPAQAVEVWFDYERSPDGTDGPITEVATLRESIQGERSPDWAVIRLAKPAPADVAPLSLRPTLPLGIDDRVYIIQHPAGGPKKVGMHHNEVRYVDRDVIQYLTDTMAGSSGSPVFNEQWEVVALHERWLDGVAANGETGVRNQGIRIERVVDALAGRGVV